MRIAYLLDSTELSGGVYVALLQAEALARRGHRVAVVSPGPEPRWFPLSRARFERSSFTDSSELASADVRVATFWTTVAPALAGARGPVFHLSQGYEAAFSFYATQRDRILAAYALPARKLAISSSLAARLEAAGHGPVENVGQAFDAAPFFPAPEPRAASDPPVIALIGPAAADVKGIRVAYEGLALWRARGGAFRLRRAATEPPTEEERTGDLVDEYHRAVEPERMPFLYRASDVFIAPSRAEEGFGLPAVEALACGLPCLLSDTPGHREMAGDAAWYFADGDPESLADALPVLLTAEARARARIAGPRAAAQFDPARVAARLERAFSRALADGPE
ncbi:MAG TPA: glycosyltransferase family 4 protein [Thermoanaerobaculia bacterium]|nr:glycosyltransferase family 4 protein [Thermoanaerobaculia bacterium]